MMIVRLHIRVYSWFLVLCRSYELAHSWSLHLSSSVHSAPLPLAVVNHHKYNVSFRLLEVDEMLAALERVLREGSTYARVSLSNRKSTHVVVGFIYLLFGTHLGSGEVLGLLGEYESYDQGRTVRRGAHVRKT